MMENKENIGRGTIQPKEIFEDSIKRYRSKTPYYKKLTSHVLNLVQPKQEDNILDIGCFAGQQEATLSHYCKITGVDIDPFAIKYAKVLCASNGRLENISLHLRNKPLNVLLKGKVFNKVIMIDLVEHLPDAELLQTLKEIKEIVCKSAKLFIYTPNKAHWSEWGFRKFYVSKWRREHESGCDFGHINLKTQMEWFEFFAKNGLKAERFYFEEGFLPFEFCKKRICQVWQAVA